MTLLTVLQTVDPGYPLLVCAVLLLLLWSARRNKQSLPLPPGPKGIPVFGSLFDMPKDKPWVVYHQWAEHYGSDLLFLRLPFQSLLIIDSAKAALDLMEKRASLYSDKPISVMDQLTGWEWDMSCHRYGPRWRNTRRNFHQHFNPDAVRQYHSVEKREVRAFLLRALDFQSGVKVRTLMQVFATAVMDIIYGIKVDNMDNEYVALMERGLLSFSESKLPGAFWVENFPFLRYLPAWMPGASAQRFGAKYKPIVMSVRERPFAVAKQDISDGIDKSCVAHKLIEKLEQYTGTSSYADYELAAKDAAGVAYGAGVDTTYSTTSWFIVALAMHPHVQEKAQRELDEVLGSNRLPEHEDITSLPYIQAIYYEVLRWRPNVPLGIPHRAMEDDEYGGYRIPKGATIIPNVWAMFQNPEDYTDPEIFNPDRFIKDGRIDFTTARDPSTIAFGFGRRICPGRYFAKDTLLLTFASMLAVFDIKPALDRDSKEAKLIGVVQGGGILSRAEEAELNNCVLKVRSAAAEQLVRESQVA